MIEKLKDYIVSLLTTIFACDCSSMMPKEGSSLCRFIPEQLHHQIWGSSVSSARQMDDATAMAHLVTQRIPTLYVYVISSAPEPLTAVANLFRGLPSLVFGLQAEQFFCLLAAAGDDNNNNENIIINTNNSNVGVDRVANYCAARFLFPSAASHLVIDAGSAFSYTTTILRQERDDDDKTSGDNHSLVLAGGFGPGLDTSWKSLYDNTGDLPLVSPDRILKQLAKCESAQQSLPTFATASSKNDDNDNDAEMIHASGMACVLQERTLLLCNVLRGWLADHKKNETPNNTTAPSQLPVVVLTGRDADIYEKLLRPQHSYIFETSQQNLQILQAAIVTTEDTISSNSSSNEAVPSGKLFRIQQVKNLFPQAVRGLLLANRKALARELLKNNNNSEMTRRRLLGQRVAVEINPGKRGPKRILGTIHRCLRTGRDDCLDLDFFSVYYDDAKGAIDDLEVEKIYGMYCTNFVLLILSARLPWQCFLTTKLYILLQSWFRTLADGLLLFHEIVSKAKPTDDPRGIRSLNKARDAKEAAALLFAQSRRVRDLVAARKKPPPAAAAAEKRPPPPPAAAAAYANAGSKKARTTNADNSVAPAASKPTAFASTETAAPTAAAPPAAAAAAANAAFDAAPSRNDYASLVGKRVAKEFDEGIFFGSIKEYLPRGSVEDADFEMWSVRYDDSDEEDLGESDIRSMLQLYEREMRNDSFGGRR